MAQKKPKPELKVALVQMRSTELLAANFEFVLSQVRRIVDKRENVDLICFPENSLFMRVNEKTPIIEVDIKDPFFKSLGQLAKENNFYIHLGSFPLRVGGELYNSTCWVSPEGKIKKGYQKLHLFDISLEGQKPIRESDIFTHGSLPKIVDVFGWKFGESICYDIRFSELYNYYARRHVDVILIPAAFLASTGKAHWNTLVRARAIESQAYVVASCQSGKHSNRSGEFRETFGQSQIIDPWGDELLNMKEEIGYNTIAINHVRVAKVREQIPMSKHRRKYLGGKAK